MGQREAEHRNEHRGSGVEHAGQSPPLVDLPLPAAVTAGQMTPTAAINGSVRLA